MADYYSHRDPRGQKGDAYYLDYEASSGVGWIWAVIVLVAVVALISLGASGGSESTAEGAAPAAAGDTTTIDAPAATTAPAATDQ